MVPFRTLPKPNVVAFFTAVMLWALLVFSALLTLCGIECSKSYWNLYSVWHQLWNEFLRNWVLVLSNCFVSGFSLGGIHYILIRVSCRKKQQAVGFHELGMVLFAVVVLSAYPGYRVARNFIDARISRACRQTEVTEEIKSLVAQGKHRQAVRCMEESCKDYQDVLKKGIPDHLKNLTRRSGANGVGYFFCTLAWGWETLVLNMPFGLRDYFDGEMRHDYASATGKELHQAERWKPLGTEMAASAAPIIRVLGYWLLEDRERFAREVYRQYDSGDQSYRALNDLVCFRYDPLPRRAIHRLLSFKPRTDRDEGNLKFYEADERIGQIYYLALGIVKTGDEIGDDAAAVRPILRQFPKTPDFRRSQYNRWSPVSSGLCRNLQMHFDNDDMDSVVRMMEIACHNLHESRGRLDEEFMLLARNNEFTPFQGLLESLSAASETFELNIPIGVVWFIAAKARNVQEDYFDKSFPETYKYRTYDEKPIFEQPEKMRKLSEKMTESATPILRALGLYLKEDRPRFISTVYQTSDSGDATFDSLHRLVSEKMDNHVKPAQ